MKKNQAFFYNSDAIKLLVMTAVRLIIRRIGREFIDWSPRKQIKHFF